MIAQEGSDQQIAGLAEARRRGAARLAEWHAALADPFSPAALEFSKAGLGEGEIRCGHEGDGADRGGVLFALRYCGLAIAAWFGVLLAICRFGGSGGRVAGTRLVALHGEVSNRTRHLLDALKAGEPADGLLVLGLPRRSLKSLREDWAHWLGDRGLALWRPVSLRAFLQSLPAGWRAVADAYRLARTCPVLPPARALSAILARLWLGEAHARWWSRKGGGVAQVVYGHTGTADTSRLELAQQAGGATTVHMVHGVSAGRNFVGLSTVAVWRCGHDADWHARLGGYGRNEWVPAERPSWRCGENGLLLLTSFAHPMYLGYRLAGIAEEVALLRAVAEAAKKAGVEGPWTWLPHPAARLLPEAERRLLERTARELGFVSAPPGKGFVELALEARWVVSSESTVVVDLMRNGVLPIMCPSPWSEADAALSAYPGRASDVVSLVGALGLPPLQQGSRFLAAWESLRPGSLSDKDLGAASSVVPNLTGGLSA